MDPDRISYLLRRKGWTQVRIAAELGVSKAVVGNVIHSRVTSHAVANFIGAVLGREVDRIWPGRYAHAPRPLRRPPVSPDAEEPPMT